MKKRIDHQKHIEHPGIVQQLAPGRVMVRIEPQTACGKCEAKAHCGMSEMQEKVIEIKVDDETAYSSGQQVVVTLKRHLGYKALWLGYLIPFMLLVGGIALVMHVIGNEPAAALSGLILTAFYYYFLFLFREKLAGTFRFEIRR